MSFYIFKLENIRVKHQRGNIADEDVVMFSLRINQLDRGHGTGTFNGMVASDVGVPGINVPLNNGMNINSNWMIGPLEIRSGDTVHVVYTGTNISDKQLVSLDTQKQDEIELKILNAIAAVGIAGFAGFGSLAEAIAAGLGEIGDPVGKLIGFKPQGPCNGPVFSDAVEFTGSGLDNLIMEELPSNNATPPQPRLSRITFTRTYTDETNHDTDVCGHFAETDITFSVFRLPFISLAWSLGDRFPKYRTGLKKFGKPKTTLSVKSLIGLQP